MRRSKRSRNGSNRSALFFVSDRGYITTLQRERTHMEEQKQSTTITDPAAEVGKKTKEKAAAVVVTTELKTKIEQEVIDLVISDAKSRGETHASIVAVGKTTVVYHGRKVGPVKVSRE
jgi:K+/H+ antiporter YhaU regulatory subunit KhtT